MDDVTTQQNTIANDVNTDINAQSVYDTNAMANALDTTTATPTATTTGTSSGLTSSLNPVYTSQDYYNDVINQNNENYINEMYQNALAAQQAQLDASHQISLNDAEAQKESLEKSYNESVNSTAVDYERQKQAFNENAAGNGLNTGTGSQAQLAMNSQYQASKAALESAKIEAQAELERQVANLNTQYQADVAAAIAENNYEKAAALLEEKNRKQEQLQTYYQMAISEAENEWNRSYQLEVYNYQQQQDAIANQLAQEQWEAEQEETAFNKQLTSAQIQAEQNGDFTALGNLYGWTDEQIAAANQMWIQQNPEQAYANGKISYSEYKNVKDKLKGKDTSSSSSSSSSWSNSYYAQLVRHGIITAASNNNLSLAQAVQDWKSANPGKSLYD